MRAFGDRSLALELSIAVSTIDAVAILEVRRPMRAMAAALSRLVSGDLAVAVAAAERLDEVGLFNVFQDNAIAA